MSEPPVVDNREENRFEIETSAGTAVLEYRRSGQRLILVHTEVPPADRKRGMGTRLVEAAFLQAQERALKIVPECPFVRDYVKRHPEVGSWVEERA